MAYTVYLSNIPMPVTPSKIETKIKNQNSTLNLIDGSEINIIKPPGLTEFSFELLIPQVKYPFAAYPDLVAEIVNDSMLKDSEASAGTQFVGAQYYLDFLEILKRDQKPFPFKIERYTPDNKKLFETKVEMDVTMEEYSIIEDAANGFDLTIPVRLKQYRPYSAQKEDITVYTVKQGDTLWGICKRFLGDGSKYPQIAKLNDIKNPNLIKVGQVIKLA